MIKMLFNAGGQPVYLDDLSAIQSVAFDAIDNLLSSLGADLSKDILYLKKPTLTYSGTKVTSTDGVLWIKGYGIVQLPAVKDLDVSSGVVYVQVIVTDSSARVYNDGQSRPCQQQVTTQLISTPTGTYYKFEDIPDGLIPALSSLIDVADKTDYTPLSVTWANGYSGVVERKSIYGGMRYHIKATSTASTWKDQSAGEIFYGALGNFVSTMFMTGGEDPTVDKPHYLQCTDSICRISSFQDLEKDPMLLPIDITFDIINDN